MCVISNNSDKLFKWSDYEKSNQSLPSSKTKAPPSTATSCRHLLSPRLPDRNLQTLRQTDLQMSKGPGTWAKVLPLRQFPRPETGNDLHPRKNEGQSAVLCRQPPCDESDSGRDQRNKSRTYSSARYVLDVDATRHRDRYQRCRGYRRQHGFGFLSCRAIQGGH
jgi:hypothetical protein